MAQISQKSENVFLRFFWAFEKHRASVTKPLGRLYLIYVNQALLLDRFSGKTVSFRFFSEIL